MWFRKRQLPGKTFEKQGREERQKATHRSVGIRQYPKVRAQKNAAARAARRSGGLFPLR